MDELVLDAKTLDDTANIIVIYCNKQREIMEDYIRRMNSLSSEWKDDETLGKLMEEVRKLATSVEQVMDTVRIKYPPYFKKQADLIRNRPKGL